MCGLLLLLLLLPASLTRRCSIGCCRLSVICNQDAQNIHHLAVQPRAGFQKVLRLLACPAAKHQTQQRQFLRLIATKSKDKKSEGSGRKRNLFLETRLIRNELIDFFHQLVFSPVHAFTCHAMMLSHLALCKIEQYDGLSRRKKI